MMSPIHIFIFLYFIKLTFKHLKCTENSCQFKD